MNKITNADQPAFSRRIFLRGARIVLTLTCLNVILPTFATDHWPQFRGPGATGMSTNTHLPDKWSATENLAWKTDITGRAWSSPIVWGNRVFLTTVVKIGLETPLKFRCGVNGEMTVDGWKTSKPSSPPPETK